NSFSVTAQAPNTVTVSIPDFARGPDANNADSINLVVNSLSGLSGGIPVTLNVPAGDTVTTAMVTLHYNDRLLSGSGSATVPISAAFPSSALGGASFTVTSSSSDSLGNATTVLTFDIGSATTKLTNGNFRLGGLVAYVPGNAPYRSKQLLQISDSS